MKLEEIKPGVQLAGLDRGVVTIKTCEWHGDSAVEVIYRNVDGEVAQAIVLRDQEEQLSQVDSARKWSFSADPHLFRLVSEALRIRLAHLFDPLLAVNTSDVEPLPHQITAVYERMLPRQPLRFLLADDPGAGKTIMAGLLIKELHLRGDVERCLVVPPGSLAEQWQDEMYEKFGLDFEILTNDQLEASRSGNWFQEHSFVIARLDKLSRDEAIAPMLEQTDWDLVVMDEAHKLSASYFGGEVRYTKRYRLAQLLSSRCRHFLLMTATPHNGKEEDFQLFMALLDEDRFEGRFRSGVHAVDTSDIMRRLVKEQLVRFDGTNLFPERRAYTVRYELSPEEQSLYETVTNYVREEFNRAERLDDSRRGNVGFALTILQRRLASSPEAIYRSLGRRRERLEARLEEEHQSRAGRQPTVRDVMVDYLSKEELEDLDEAPNQEAEDIEDLILDKATSAETIEELEKEIQTLRELERLAGRILKQGTDKKWEQVSGLLQTHREMFDDSGNRRKLVVFTEHRDTLRYLARKIRTLLGDEAAVVTISGGMKRDERRRVEHEFRQNPSIQILVATDAAGEGINLQRAHLMINYDLPWNPNRLEQRFGRIHRIGQTEVCHLWNLVAHETREGDVFVRLLEKLEREREDLQGKVFDVLGQVFQGTELRDLLIQAIRAQSGTAEIMQVVDRVEELLDTERLRQIIEKNALSQETFDSLQIREVRDLMERARVRKLQPHFIRSFFVEAFHHLGGSIRKREPDRYEITRVPAVVRNHQSRLGGRAHILPRYERVTFHREAAGEPGTLRAELVTPGHPLLASTIDVLLERQSGLFTDGALLVDDVGTEEQLRVLVYLEHTIVDARRRSQRESVASQRLQFVEIDEEGRVTAGGYAPFHGYRAATTEEQRELLPLDQNSWAAERIEKTAVGYAVERMVPEHIAEVRTRRAALVEKTMAEVRKRLTREITYWDRRAAELHAAEQAGKVNARVNAQLAGQRVEELQRRLKARLDALEEERHVSAKPPRVIGAALIVPARGLDRTVQSGERGDRGASAEVERLAMEAVLLAERDLGNRPVDVGHLKRGWDIESRDPRSGMLRFIEVKGREASQETLTLTRNEIVQGLNNPDQFILAIVLVDEQGARPPRYVRSPFSKEPEWNSVSTNFQMSAFLERSTEPE